MLIVLILATKLMGKKQISQITIYDYVVGITIGSIAADIILTLDESIFNGIIAILIFAIIGYTLSFLAIKNDAINKLLNGKPTVLMEGGNFIYDNLKRTRITVHKFIEEARLNGYYDINVLSYAVLETNGKISFLPKEEYQASTPIDFKTELKKNTKQTYCENLIVDGKIMSHKLYSLGKDKKWLEDELNKKKIDSIDSIILATIDEKDKLRIYKEI